MLVIWHPCDGHVTPVWWSCDSHVMVISITFRCAFQNTPKFNQVKSAGGCIVWKEWIIDCFSEKQKLPAAKWVTWLTCDYTFLLYLYTSMRHWPCEVVLAKQYIASVHRVAAVQPHCRHHPKLQKFRQRQESMKLKQLHNQAWAKRRMTPTVAPLTRRWSQKQFRNQVGYSCRLGPQELCCTSPHYTVYSCVCSGYM